MKTREYENLAGRYDFRLRRLNRWLESKFLGIQFLTPAQEAIFWTDERLSLGNQVFDLLYRHLQEYGIPHQSFSKKLIDLHYYNPLNTSEFEYVGPRTRRIILPVYDDLNDAIFVRILLHAGGHFFETRIKEKGRGRFIRFGTSMKTEKPVEIVFAYPIPNETPNHSSLYTGYVNDMIKAEDGERYYFWYLNEGIVEKTARDIFALDFPDLAFKYRQQIGRFHPYEKMVWFIEEMTKIISVAQPNQLPHPQEAFKLFQKATYGKGDWLPLARIIRRTWGSDALSYLSQIMVAYDNRYNPKTEIVPRYISEIMDHFLYHVLPNTQFG